MEKKEIRVLTGMAKSRVLLVPHEIQVDKLFL